MKNQTYFANLLTRWLLILLASMFLVPALRAQLPRVPRPETRVLLVFDTSSAMKKRLPAEVKGIKQLFALSLAERLQTGDTIGVWTFDRDVHAGEYPLETWHVQGITEITSNILDYIETRSYSHSTSFNKLTPLIDHVVSISPRVIIVIFCDGEGQFVGTPFDDSVNAAFKQHAKDMRKADEPFVIVLRGEDNHYTGSTINSAESINVPHFPEAGPSPQFPPPDETAPAPPPPPASPAPPLIIVGNSVGTNLPPPPPPPTDIIKEAPHTNAAPPAVSPPPQSSVQTNTTPMVQTVQETNPPPPVAIAETPTNVAIPAVTTPPISPAATAPAAVPPVSVTTYPNGGFTMEMKLPSSRDIAFAAAAVLLIVAVAATWFIVRRSRRHDSPSLITESLKKR